MPEVAQISAVSAAPSPSRHRRGYRRGGSRGALHQPPPTPREPPEPCLASHDPASEIVGLSQETAAPRTQGAYRGRYGRSGRGGRGVNRRGAGQLPYQVHGGRQFGGQLTSNSPSTTPPGGSLSGEAPVFVPGRPITSRPGGHQARTQTRRMSKSQAPDIATRIHEDIANRQYECVICTNEVMTNSKIWSCRTCWSVLHLSCVKRWSKNEVATHQQRADENGELPPPRQWRCPGCNLPKEGLPENYMCWCEKEAEPHSIAGLPPHSCGQTCSKAKAGRCPHPCDLICHAGPCPPCSLTGPRMRCFCGKEEKARRCLDTNYDSGWSCDQVCGDMLPCGEHQCQRNCHEGLCGSCEVSIDSRCYCGKEEKALPCSERNDGRQSNLEDDVWIGAFNCGQECRRPFDCTNPDHFCQATCHVQDLEPAHCPFSPDVVKSCPCGKSPIETLMKASRTTCSDPIPFCEQKCERLLSCGHHCRLACHEGDCGLCAEMLEVPCCCGRASFNTLCHLRSQDPPVCNRICRTTLNCGRHECGAQCCAGEKLASERQAAKRGKPRASRPPDENIEAEHICLKICGRPLKCGNHFCAELCHKGPCSSCREAVFNEIACSCGRTVLQPPLPCGTTPPACTYECTRPRNCTHPHVKHQCHGDDDSCPKCPFLVEKACICGKKTLKNQPCWFTEVRCGLPCGKKLKCGIHTCQNLCHRAGQCEDATSPCTQLCGRQKTVCDHTCADPCHAPYPCKEVTPCQAKTFMTCPCQHQKMPTKCLASKTSEGNSKKSLECNDECLRLQRNARLAAALNIDPETHTDGHIPYSKTTLDLFASSPKTSQSHEREIRVFAADDDQKRLRFKPMKSHERAFVHALAEDFGLDSESQDPEPHRHVCIFKTPRFVSAPMKTLSQCISLRQALTAELTSTASKPTSVSSEPWNAFLLTKPKFGLTMDELRTELEPELRAGGFVFDILFLPSSEVILKALPSAAKKTEILLATSKARISRKITTSGLAESITACHLDAELNISRKEDDHAGGGWSQVAKGASASRAAVPPVLGAKSSFTILGTKGLKKVKKEAVEEAVEDWEREMEGWDDGTA